MSNLEESLIRHGLTADRFDIEDCPEGKKITIRKAVAPPMPTDAEWQDHLDGNAEIYGTGFCYFIGAVGMSLVKIGYAANVKARLNHMQVNSPVELVLLAVAPGGAYRERAYHFQFGEHRVRGEWFERCPEIEAEIARLAA